MEPKTQEVLAECARLESKGQYREAVGLLSGAISSSPTAELFFRRGEVYESLREFQAARDDYSIAINANPKSRRYLVARGQVLYNHLESIFQAIDDFDEAVSVDPASPIPHYHLCFCYLLLSNLDNAFEHANRALQLDPLEAVSHLCLAKCHLITKNIQSALDELRTAASLEPQNSLYWGELARVLKRDGEISQALEYYEKAVQIEPSAMGYIAVAGVQLDLGNRDAAIESVNLAKSFPMSDTETLLAEGYLARAETSGGKETR